MVEKLRGEPLDAVVARPHHRRRSGMTDTGYNPTDKARTAATEYQTAPPRGMVRGEVHDENAWSLGGVAGHAGVFSTVDDLAVLSQALLNGGTYRGDRILSRKSVEAAHHQLQRRLPRRLARSRLRARPAVVHGRPVAARAPPGTPATPGTSIVIDFTSRSFAILLTNRVHPSRSWGSINLARREWAHGPGAVDGHPPAARRHGLVLRLRDNATTTTLTTHALAGGRRGARRLGFDLFLDTEETDLLHLERSTDGGATWTALPFEVVDRGQTETADGVISGAGTRRWVQVRADLPAGHPAAALAAHDRRRLPRSGRRRRRRPGPGPGRRPARRREDP